MQANTDSFIKLATAVVAESGDLLSRPSWVPMTREAQVLCSQADSFLTGLEMSHALLFIAAASSENNRFGAALRRIWNYLLISVPDANILTILAALPKKELKDTLIPFFYEQGNRSSVACYVAAVLHLTVVADSVSYFLSAHTWTQSDLINLACLVPSEDGYKVSALLEDLSRGNVTQTVRETYSEFRYIIFNSGSLQPLLPDLNSDELALNLKELEEQKKSAENAVKPSAGALPGQAVQQTRAAEAEAAQKTGQAPVQNTQLPQKQGGADETPSNTAKAPNPKEILGNVVGEFSKKIDQCIGSSDGEDILSKILAALKPYRLPAAIIFGCLVIGALLADTYYSRLSIEFVEKDGSVMQKSLKSPEAWIDSGSNRKITQQYLKADKEFRMGELFLLRNQYADALQMYEDALAIEPSHLAAIIQSGFCHLQMKNYKNAETQLKKALKISPRERVVNLYLARAALGRNDVKQAKKYYLAEYNNSKDISTGMEYANFLAEYVSQDDAMEFVGNLQTLYPDKSLMLSVERSGKGKS